MRVKISNEALERVARKIRGQEYALPQESFESIEGRLDNTATELGEILSEASQISVPMEDLKRIEQARAATVSAWTEFGREGKSGKKSQVPTLEELDETFEMDEAHQEFMRGEEGGGRVLGQQEIEDITANALNSILDEIQQYSGLSWDEFYSTLEKTDAGMEFTEKLSTAISSVVSSYTE